MQNKTFNKLKVLEMGPLLFNKGHIYRTFQHKKITTKVIYTIWEGLLNMIFLVNRNGPFSNIFKLVKVSFCAFYSFSSIINSVRSWNPCRYILLSPVKVYSAVLTVYVSNKVKQLVTDICYYFTSLDLSLPNYTQEK